MCSHTFFFLLQRLGENKNAELAELVELEALISSQAELAKAVAVAEQETEERERKERAEEEAKAAQVPVFVLLY